MEVDLLIDGHASPASKGGTFERRDPVTGEVATRAAAAGVEDARRAADCAAAAFPGWASLGPGARRKLLLGAADLMET
jgi:acyl-CoA reductase-like NAD-dependent aldehyde dehydrogenase